MDVDYPLEHFSTYAAFRDLRQYFQQYGFLTSTTASATEAAAFDSAVLRPHLVACALLADPAPPPTQPPAALLPE